MSDLTPRQAYNNLIFTLEHTTLDMEKIKKLLKEGGKIPAIKYYRNHFTESPGLKQSKEFIDVLVEKYNLEVSKSFCTEWIRI